MQRRMASIVVSVAAAIASVAIWNLAVTEWRFARSQPPGEYYTVEGHRMYLRCTGESRAVVCAHASGLRQGVLIAHDSGHPVHHDRPDLVVAEMTQLVTYLRGGESPPFGSTLIR